MLPDLNKMMMMMMMMMIRDVPDSNFWNRAVTWCGRISAGISSQNRKWIVWQLLCCLTCWWCAWSYV